VEGSAKGGGEGMPSKSPACEVRGTR